MVKLFLVVLLYPLVCLAERAPQAEYPYPNSTESSLGIEKPEKIQKGSYYYGKKKASKKKPYGGVEQPVSIGDDGSYYYGDAEASDKAKSLDGVEKAIDTDDEGGYYYKKAEKPKGNVKYGPKPNKVTSDGSYLYSQPPGETKNVLSIRAGMISAPDIQPIISGGSNYQDVYGDSGNFAFNFEYDWLLFGTVFLKAGSGIATVSGQGTFKDPTLNPANPQPRETFQFITMPNTLSLSYRFQIWDLQYFTPYIEGGPGYFSFIEMRSDGDMKYGGAPVMTATGGLLISMSMFMEGTTLNAEYGITQTWIDLQFKQIVGLDERKDFTSNMITAGFAVGF